ncbi:MAG: hypothetical protein ACREJD_12130 [Phycisphaerales bacterium]
MTRRTRIQILVTMVIAMAATFSLSIFCFMFRGTELFILTEQEQSIAFREVMNSSGYGWSMFAFGGFGWTEIEQEAITPRDSWYQPSRPSPPYPNAPYRSSASETPIPDDDSRFCPTYRKKRVDAAFGWPMRVLALRAESVWMTNPNGPSQGVNEAYSLYPLVGWHYFGRTSPIRRLVGFSSDGLIPGRVLWVGLIADTAFFIVLICAPVACWRAYRRLRARIQRPIGLCTTVGMTLRDKTQDQLVRNAERKCNPQQFYAQCDQTQQSNDRLRASNDGGSRLPVRIKVG